MVAPFETAHEEPSGAEPHCLSAQRLTMAIDRVTSLEFRRATRKDHATVWSLRAVYFPAVAWNLLAFVHAVVSDDAGNA